MSYSLEEFCINVRELLANENVTAREKVRSELERLLADPAFCRRYVGPDSEPGVVQIFEDGDTGFCVLAYNMEADRRSPPHDHGSSWAVYGQAVGYTDMTIWEASERDIKPVREFRLEPGQAGLFDVREIHSIRYPAGSKFVRVTGVDMAGEMRRVYDPQTGACREVGDMGAGRA